MPLVAFLLLHARAARVALLMVAVAGIVTALAGDRPLVAEPYTWQRSR